MGMREYQQGELQANWLSKANANAINSGNTTNGVQVITTSTPYVEAVVHAIKPGADVVTTPTNNAGVVYICSGANTLSGCIQLVSGNTLTLPDNGDLSDYYLAVATANDAISVVYMTER